MESNLRSRKTFLSEYDNSEYNYSRSTETKLPLKNTRKVYKKPFYTDADGKNKLRNHKINKIKE